MSWIDSLFGRSRTATPPEVRGLSYENPSVSLSNVMNFMQSLQFGPGFDVNEETALSVPAIWCAVNFISGNMASLPLQQFQRDGDGTPVRIKDGRLAGILSGTINDDCLTSFKWRSAATSQSMLGGRSFTFIERNKAGAVINLWLLEASRVTIQREDNRTRYIYRDGAREVTYQASEIIDLPILLRSNLVAHYSPITILKDTIGMGVALQQYAARFFQNGGVPPMALHIPLGSAAGNQRAAIDVEAAVREANVQGRNVLVLPMGAELKPVGFDPEKNQLVEAQRFIVEQVARMYQLPPVFLQDLSHGTYSNTEQQDIHVVKHTLGKWVQLWETELNAKLFGPRNTSMYVKFNVDGLLRGDFKTRSEGYSAAIQSGQMTPNEARDKEDRPPKPGGDRLLIQGATVALEDPIPTDPAPAGA